MTAADCVFDDRLIDTYTDEELFQIIERSPNLLTTRTEHIIHVLSPDLVAKWIMWPQTHLDEIDAMEKARSVGINVPLVHRVLAHSNNGYVSHAIIMDRVHGKTLEQMWPHLGLWSTIRVAFQLRSVVSTLRTITSQTTGGLNSGKLKSPWIEAKSVPIPHASPSMFCDYLNWWLLKAGVPEWKPRPELLFSAPSVHVFVHHDLAARNMILDATGRLWVIDWRYSGFYPAYMEYLGMRWAYLGEPWFATRTFEVRWARMRFKLLTWIACGYSSFHAKSWAAMAVVSRRSQTLRAAQPPNSVRY